MRERRAEAAAAGLILHGVRDVILVYEFAAKLRFGFSIRLVSHRRMANHFASRSQPLGLPHICRLCRKPLVGRMQSEACEDIALFNQTTAIYLSSMINLDNAMLFPCSMY